MEGKKSETINPKSQTNSKSEFPKLKFIEKDEDDGYDEAWALYNAPQEYFDGYDYSEHLIDDQLDYYVSTIEGKIGKTGHLVVVLDACHSGSGTRGSTAKKKRGSSKVCAPKNYKRTLYVIDSKNFDEFKSGKNAIHCFH